MNEFIRDNFTFEIDNDGSIFYYINEDCKNTRKEIDEFLKDLNTLSKQERIKKFSEYLLFLSNSFK